MIAGRGGGWRKRRNTMTSEQRAQAEHDVGLAVARLQHTAYANLRSAIANVAIFFGFVGVFTIAMGAADGARLVPTAVCVLAGVVGGCYYAARQRPILARYLLVAASALVLIGIAGLVFVVQVLDS